MKHCKFCNDDAYKLAVPCPYCGREPLALGKLGEAIETLRALDRLHDDIRAALEWLKQQAIPFERAVRVKARKKKAVKR